jgi:hypothetical protein
MNGRMERRYRIRPVARRSPCFLPLLLIALALLAPLAAGADPCPDCGGSLQGCCASQGCSCCLPGSCVRTTLGGMDLGLRFTGLVVELPADRGLTADPRDVFHVPRPPLA